MPLFRTPTTQDLEDHFFGSGAFSYGWFDVEWGHNGPGHFPVILQEIDEDGTVIESKEVTEESFIEGIKLYAAAIADRSFDDLIDDMDAADVDNVLQLIMFGEIRYS